MRNKNESKINRLLSHSSVKFCFWYSKYNVTYLNEMVHLSSKHIICFGLEIRSYFLLTQYCLVHWRIHYLFMHMVSLLLTDEHKQTRHEVIIYFLCSTELSTEIIMLEMLKCQHCCWHLTFMSMMNTSSESMKA